MQSILGSEISLGEDRDIIKKVPQLLVFDILGHSCESSSGGAAFFKWFSCLGTVVKEVFC